MADLSVRLAPATSHGKGLLLANPVMTASGTFGYGTETGDIPEIQKLGAIICKGTTLRPREGNPQPRLAETACGALNSIGLQNVGVDALIKDKAPIWAGWQVPVIVNIAGETVTEYGEIAKRLDGVPGISGIEVNISCPNVACGGMEFGVDSALAGQVTAAVRKACGLPVIVKLSPNVTDMVEIAKAAAGAGADALTVMNTVRGMVIDVAKGRPSLGNIVGGLSGPAIRPIAVFWTYRVSAAVKLPIIGSGGIMKTADALEFIMAGAWAVQVGTASLGNPRAALDILAGLSKYAGARNLKSLADIRGIARG